MRWLTFGTPSVTRPLPSSIASKPVREVVETQKHQIGATTSPRKSAHELGYRTCSIP